jgi:hypothetical protein
MDFPKIRFQFKNILNTYKRNIFKKSAYTTYQTHYLSIKVIFVPFAYTYETLIKQSYPIYQTICR